MRARRQASVLVDVGVRTRMRMRAWETAACESPPRCALHKIGLTFSPFRRDMDREVDTDMTQRKPVPQWGNGLAA
jgi:hypothetical protein